MLLEELTPLERAAYLLHDIFGYSFEEVARSLGRTAGRLPPTGARARRHVEERRQRFDADLRARPRAHRPLPGRVRDGRPLGPAVDALRGRRRLDRRWRQGAGGDAPGRRAVPEPRASCCTWPRRSRVRRRRPCSTASRRRCSSTPTRIVAALVLDILDGPHRRGPGGQQPREAGERLTRTVALETLQSAQAELEDSSSRRRTLPDGGAGKVVDDHELLGGGPRRDGLGHHPRAARPRTARRRSARPRPPPARPTRGPAASRPRPRPRGVRDQDALDESGQTFSAPVVMTSSRRPDTTSLPVGSESPGVAGGEPGPRRRPGPATRPSDAVAVAAEQHRSPEQDLALPRAVASRARPSRTTRRRAAQRPRRPRAAARRRRRRTPSRSCRRWRRRWVAARRVPCSRPAARRRRRTGRAGATRWRPARRAVARPDAPGCFDGFGLEAGQHDERRARDDGHG